jgi:Asp-tRNA(Asn)/Glu-tRNA(Gln) amidotransferase C subunit
VDVEGVPPATDAGVGAGSTRPDVVDTGLAAAADALGQVPDRDGAFVRVPKVM